MKEKLLWLKIRIKKILLLISVFTVSMVIFAQIVSPYDDTEFIASLAITYIFYYYYVRKE
jgi:hypothetical protein